MLLALLKNIKHEAQQNISLLIIDDCSSKNYAAVKKYLDKNCPNAYDYYKTEKNYGKKDYWQLINFAYKLLQKIKTVTDQPVLKVVVSHFHADHIYGLQVFEELGAEIIAPYGAQKYIRSDAAKERLEERQFSLEPWVNEDTHLVLPDTTVTKSTEFTMGGLTFIINYMGKAHSDGDLTMLVEPDKVLFSGDIIFEGRIPFVGSADSKKWLETLTRLDTDGLTALVPGHGPASSNPKNTISLTRRYLAHLRKVMGTGIEDLEPFDEVYAAADWSEFKDLPAFAEGNRINAYQVYLSMEAELLEQ